MTRIYLEITAYWGNDDAESSIKVSRRRWAAIQDGASFSTTAWSFYEGGRFLVTWRFAGGEVSIDGDDGMVCVLDLPVSELVVQTLPDQRSGSK